MTRRPASQPRTSRDRVPAAVPPAVPVDLGRTPVGKGSTQRALGRALVDLTSQAPAAATRVVTVSPDVASSTDFGGWLNKVGSWSPGKRVNWFVDDAETILHWRETPTGQHIELGIAETNLVALGVGCDVLCITSPDLLFRAARARQGRGDGAVGS